MSKGLCRAGFSFDSDVGGEVRSFDDIAKELGLHKRTVQKDYERAIRKIQKQLRVAAERRASL
jgi:DNA-directed RNA polymerase specialized sigma24 family protein